MKVIVKRGDVVFTCTTEEQLNSFLEDGYVVAEKSESPKPATTKKASKAK